MTDITPQTLDTAALETAVADIAAALAAPAPAADAPPPPPPVEIKSAISFPVAADDVAAVIAEGSPERTEFESGCTRPLASVFSH